MKYLSRSLHKYYKNDIQNNIIKELTGLGLKSNQNGEESKLQDQNQEHQYNQNHNNLIDKFLSNKKISYQGNTHIASRQEAIDKIQSQFSQKNIQMVSYYNSELNIIIEDSDLMVVPIDDRIFNRAHGIFESITFSNFQFNTFDEHVDRLFTSCLKAGIDLDMTKEQVTNILQDLAQHTYYQLTKQGMKIQELFGLVIHLRLWISSGRQDFGIYSVGKKPILYCCTFVNKSLALNLGNLKQGIKEYTLDHQLISQIQTVKSTSYLSNCIIADYSKAKGGYQGIKLDEDGHVLELAMANVGYVDKQSNQFIVVPPEKIIPGTTLKKVVEGFVPHNEDIVPGVKREYFTVQNILENASEFMSFGGDKIIPILQIDDQNIGTGQIGPVCKKMQEWYEKQQEIQKLQKKDVTEQQVIPIKLVNV